ncbi:hypothetical protein F751_0105 [Auxenochlorella protothecoides]|uniref:Uncharacterized protein n=1 Tax=Auxenochlorella protothecoides TaxID=3075 RepID=A0A087S9M9_AUXPR|nr:hypothetical protein F751_0105 [Auxenochlorella protothecoides]KFM22433.1 hypothetical protein F751_0105 [Auxenochlorella protothecoides]
MMLGDVMCWLGVAEAESVRPGGEPLIGCVPGVQPHDTLRGRWVERGVSWLHVQM